MPSVQSFEPISDLRARILILGSMPGKTSLAAQEYYAHPRNAFWKIIGELLDLNPTATYAERVHALKHHGIAVWDVMQTCTREGSLDSDIVEASIVPNDFQNFFDLHSNVQRVYFNGSKAEAAFRRYVLPELTLSDDRIMLKRLPSTSPANATLSFEQKRAAWHIITA